MGVKMQKEECIGEFDPESPECKSCAVISTCKRKQVKIIHTCFEKWKDVQGLRFVKKKLEKQQREYKSLVRHLGQEIGIKSKEEEAALDEYNRFMTYQKMDKVSK